MNVAPVLSERGSTGLTTPRKIEGKRVEGKRLNGLNVLNHKLESYPLLPISSGGLTWRNIKKKAMSLINCNPPPMKIGSVRDTVCMR